MAVTQNPLIGRASGSVANFVMGKWKDKHTVRSKPLTVANPRTDKQINHRNRFKMLISIYKIISTAITLGFVAVKSTMTELNGFVKANMTAAFTQNPDGSFTLDPTFLKVSEGSLYLPTLASNVNGANVDITWPTLIPPGNSGSATDYIVVVALGSNGEAAEAVVFGDVLRSDGIASVPTALFASSNTILLHAFFVSENGAQSSDSVLCYEV